MLLSEFLQRQGNWRFDLRSAIIGALLAWILAGLAYSQREAIREGVQRIWAPIATWRRRVQASQEEKYVRALKEALRPLLLFAPEDPTRIFLPPSYRALAPLPKSIAELAQSPRTVSVPYASFLQGHSKLVITGQPGSGRTTSLVMAAWQVTQPSKETSEQPYSRMPVWVDLAAFPALEMGPKSTTLDRMAKLAADFLPDLVDKWLLRHLKSEPALILLDNWDTLDEEQRDQVAEWIGQADELMADALWLVATGPSGYAALVEQSFVATELLPPASKALLPDLYVAWAALESKAAGDGPDEETVASLARAVDDRAPLWEIHARVVLHLMSGSLPARPVEVFAELLDARMASVTLGRGSEAILDDAKSYATDILIQLAARLHAGDGPLTNPVIGEVIEAVLPPKPERSRRLHGAVQKLVAESGIIRRVGRSWVPDHSLWVDYLTAVHLAADDETGTEIVRSHIDNPTWATLSEFYVGLVDAEDLATDVVTLAEIERDHSILLRAARWASAADPEQTWNKIIIKALAQSFMRPYLDTETRHAIGQALARVAGAGARAFFLRTLKHPAPEIRCAALRGLGWSGSPRDMSIMGAALQDEDLETQRSAVAALVDLSTPGAITFLSDNLPAVDEALMEEIAGALAQLPSGWEALEQHTVHEDLMVRRAATLGLGQIDEAWANERLVEIAREDSQWIVRSAAETALQMQEEEVGRDVHVAPPPQPDQMEWLMAWAARQGLGLGIGEAAMETLLEAAQRGNVDDKILSALTLAHIGRKTDLLALDVLTGDLDLGVQDAAQWAAERIKRRYRFDQPAA